MITGNIAMPRITGNMKAQRADHFHGKLVGALLGAQEPAVAHIS